MRKLAFLVAAALCYGLAPFTPRLGPVAGSVALVVLAVLLAVAASGVAASLAVAGGALGAFTSGMLAASSPALAGATLAALCFGERTLRVRGNARLLHIGAALGGGALAGTLTTSFALAPLPVRAVAVTVAAVLLALPLLVAADDPVAHALEGAATDLGGTAGASLKEAAELRRAVDEELLDAGTARQVHATWATLLRLTEARLRLSRSPAGGAVVAQGAASPGAAVQRRVDERIGDHVKALSRAYTAAGAARAAEVSLDDSALRGMENAGESLEEVSRAIVDQG